jgi:hypothetical protein
MSSPEAVCRESLHFGSEVGSLVRTSALSGIEDPFVFTRFGFQLLTSNELVDSSTLSSYQVNLNLAVTKIIALHFQRTSAVYRLQRVVIAHREECATIYPLMNTVFVFVCILREHI